MAGDLNLSEFLFDAGLKSVSAAPSPILHEYGRLKIALGPQRGTASSSISKPTRLEHLGLEAFRLRESEAFLGEKSRRPGNDQVWKSPGFEPPYSSALMPPQGSHLSGVPSNPSYRLSGRIGVGIIIVSGPEALTVTDAEELKLIADVQNGLSWLGAQSPAKDVTFLYDLQHEHVDVADVPANSASFEMHEAAWRDAMLNGMGFPPGVAGLRDYSQAVRTKVRADYAFVGLFTKYSLGHFAYAYTGETKYSVMNVSCGPWTSANLDRVFVHETCHIFGAPDEYAASGCDCGGGWGHYKVPNVNCELCAHDGGIECIMRTNRFTMCSATPYHVGFAGLAGWSGT